MDFERTSVDQKRDEQDAKMVSRPFKVNLYFEIDLIERKIRKPKDKSEFYTFGNNRILFVIFKMFHFWFNFNPIFNRKMVFLSF